MNQLTREKELDGMKEKKSLGYRQSNEIWDNCTHAIQLIERSNLDAYHKLVKNNYFHLDLEILAV